MAATTPRLLECLTSCDSYSQGPLPFSRVPLFIPFVYDPTVTANCKAFSITVFFFKGLIYFEYGRRNGCWEARLTSDILPAACVPGFLAYIKLINASSQLLDSPAALPEPANSFCGPFRAHLTPFRMGHASNRPDTRFFPFHHRTLFAALDVRL